MFQSPKSSFVLILLALAARTAVAQNTPSKSERDAYKAAIHHRDVQARTKSLELFLKTFSGSTLAEAALESLASLSFQSGNLHKERAAVERLLEENKNNLYGLTKKAELMLLECNSEDCERELTPIADHGFHILNFAAKPEYLSEAEFEHQKTEAARTFDELAGVAAITRRDYGTAQEHYVTLVKSDPNNYGYVYPLALSYLNSIPPDISRGLFFLARAAALSPANGKKDIEDYGRKKYEKYHGSAQGWSDVLRLARANPQLPSGFTITPALN